MTILRAAATANDTLDATTPTLITGLQLVNPASGDYLLSATIEILTDAASGADMNDFEVYVGSTQVTHSFREYLEDTSIDAATVTMVLTCMVSPNGSENVEIRHSAASSSTPLIAQRREMCLFPKPTSGTNYEETATGDDTTSATDWPTLGSMSRTPVSGKYLLTFSANCVGPSGATLGFRVEVGGTPLQHTERLQEMESSRVGEIPILIACEVNPNGSQVVEIAWTRTAGSGTITCHERVMTLTPIASGDIVEATGTTDDSDSTTNDVLIDDMTITDPGDDTWLMFFSASDFMGTIGDNLTKTYRMKSGGTTVTDSDRKNDHEGSLDDTDLGAFAGGRVTVASSTDDLQMYWQGSSTDTRTVHDRTFVGIRESSGEEASGTPSIAKPTSSGTAEIEKQADGTPSIAKPTSAGTAEIEKLASGTPEIAKPTSTGVAEVEKVASGTPDIAKPTSVGSATIEKIASGAPSIAKPTSTGNVDLVWAASGSPSIAKPTSAGGAVLKWVATGTPSISKPSSTGTVEVEKLGAGTPSIAKPISSGIAFSDPPEITDVDGDETWNDEATGLIITGTGFV
jgi:hypothetical protein